ncbi:MAG: hypothetical protein V4726_07195 [Verrucomicrobiota bacterium]
METLCPICSISHWSERGHGPCPSCQDERGGIYPLQPEAPFTIWARPPETITRITPFKGGAIWQFTVLYRIILSSFGRRHSLMVPFGPVPNSYFPARRAD